MIIQWKWQIDLKGLDLIDRVPEELWTEVCDIVQEAVIKTIPKKKKGKMVVWGALTNSYEKKRIKRRRKKGCMVGVYLTGILGWVREENSMIENNLIKVSIIASSILAWRILWTEEPGGLLSRGSHRVGHDWSDLACMHALEKEWQPTPVFLPGEYQGRRSLWAAIYGVAQSWTQLKRLTSSSSSSNSFQLKNNN